MVKRDKIVTPNGAEGLKTYGTFSVEVPNTSYKAKAEYMLVFFTSQNILQQVIITWPLDDDYADEMVERIVNSIELKPDELEEEK